MWTIIIFFFLYTSGITARGPGEYVTVDRGRSVSVTGENLKRLPDTSRQHDCDATYGPERKISSRQYNNTRIITIIIIIIIFF